jgi:hypothetical protein
LIKPKNVAIKTTFKNKGQYKKSVADTVFIVTSIAHATGC